MVTIIINNNNLSECICICISQPCAVCIMLIMISQVVLIIWLVIANSYLLVLRKNTSMRERKKVLY